MPVPDTPKKPAGLAPPPLPPAHRAPEEDPRVIELNGHVGFDSLPHQVVKKAIEQGFQFNLMCVGETGIGKTTLIESLFNMKLEFDPCGHELTSVELRSKSYDVTEGGVRLKLTIVETAGFGDQWEKDKGATIIVDYINEQFEKYLKEELKVRRMLTFYDDTRIHACLYFISPTGLGLKNIDLVTLRELSKRVNVIPVIAKSDTVSKDELIRFKTKILTELAQQKIEIYQFPTDDEMVALVNTEMNAILPFAIVGSTDFVKKENGKMVRARRYPWGIVEVENEQHCDFVKLRDALLRTNVDNLRERTHWVLYESYRRERLRQLRVGDGDTGPRMAEVFTQKQQEHNAEIARKEVEMRAEFENYMNKKERELKSEEENLATRNKDMEDDFSRQLKMIEEEMRQLVEERTRLEAKTLKKRK